MKTHENDAHNLVDNLPPSRVFLTHPSLLTYTYVHVPSESLFSPTRVKRGETHFYVIPDHFVPPRPTPHHIIIHSPCPVTKTTICPKVSILLIITCTAIPHRPSTPSRPQLGKWAKILAKISGSFKIFPTSSLYFRTWTIFSKKIRTE